MSLHLNGWQRVGIVASVLWVIGGSLAGRDADIRRASAMYSATYGICTQAEELRSNYDFSGCSKQASEAYEVQLKGSWEHVAVVSFGTVILAWPLAYMLIGIWRWVKRGFKTSSPR